MFVIKQDNSGVSTEHKSPTTTNSDDHKFSLLLEPNSLLILKDTMYSSYLHGIQEKTQDEISDRVANLALTTDGHKCGDKLERTCRVSLTIRYVPKTLKIQLRLGKR